MFKFALWIGGLLVAVALIAPRVQPGVSVPIVSQPEATATPVPAGNGFAEVALQRAPDGHFYADGMVNGAQVHFIVDTGATSVALTRADAQAAGIQFAPGDFTATGRGAGGAIALKPVSIDRVAVGPVEAHNVDGVIVDGDLPVSLLGQSWLRRVGAVTITGDTMVLR